MTLDFRALEDRSDRRDTHVDHDDEQLESLRARVNNIEGWAKGRGFASGSGLLFANRDNLPEKERFGMTIAANGADGGLSFADPTSHQT